MATTLDQLGVPFMLTGSYASSFQGRPRTTHDIDVVVDIPPERVDALLAAFPPSDFYLSREAIEQALRQRGMFNLIDLREADKIDFWLLTDDPFDRSRFARRQRIEFEDATIDVSSPEDTIIMKLRWSRDAGGSRRHYADAVHVFELQRQALDLSYIEHWIQTLGLTDDWRRLVDEAKPVE